MKCHRIVFVRSRVLQGELVTDSNLEDIVLSVAAVKSLGHTNVITAIDDNALIFIRQTNGNGEVKRIGIVNVTREARISIVNLNL